MAKKAKVDYSTEYCILDPDGNLYKRGLYDEWKALKKAIELRGKFGEKFKYRPFKVLPVKDVL